MTLNEPSVSRCLVSVVFVHFSLEKPSDKGGGSAGDVTSLATATNASGILFADWPFSLCFVRDWSALDKNELHSCAVESILSQFIRSREEVDRLFVLP